MQVRELMNRSVVSIAPDESVALAARLLGRHNLGALPVCARDGSLVGIVTDRDIVVRCIAAGEDPLRVPVADIMSPHPVTVAPTATIPTVASAMARSQIRRLPVTQDGQVVGMLSLGDLARCRKCDTEAAQALGDICASAKQRK